MENWIIPCNVKRFDLYCHFEKTNQVVWKNSFSMKVGDVAYIYVGTPVRQIKFRCNVVSDQVTDELLQENKYAISENNCNNYFSKKVRYVILELEREFPDGVLQFVDLQENGLGQVQIQARTGRRLQHYIDEVESNLL